MLDKKFENKFILSCLAAVVALFFFFGSQHLSRFVTADEHYWLYERIPQYWKALSDGKLKKTLINDKPGITVALISGTGLISESDPVGHKTKIDNNLDRYDVARSESLYRSFRLPILILNGSFLFFFFWIIRKISNRWIALWSAAFIGLSPILVGISQIVNPDSLLWTFSAAAIFSYFALLKYNQKKYLYLAALFTGLAILSKYTANILFPFYFLALLTHFLSQKPATDASETVRYLKLQLRNFWLLTIGSFLVISILLPAVFVKPVYLYRLTLGFSAMPLIFGSMLALTLFFYFDPRSFGSKISLAAKKHLSRNDYWTKLPILAVSVLFLILIIGRNAVPDWKMFEILPFDLKDLSYADNFGYYPSLLEKYLLELSPLVFSVTPLVIFLTFFAWARLLLLRNRPDNFFYVFTATFFILIYYTGSIASDVMAIVRYSIPLYPLLGFLAALGLWDVLQLRPEKMKRKLLPLMAPLVIILSSFSLFASLPFYFNYTNFLLPKDKLISDAWGYGGYEAAQYLNSLPDPENITIWADYYGVCEFFKGRCLTDYEVDPARYTPDYYVLTRRGKIRYGLGLYDAKPNAIKAHKYYPQASPLWEKHIGGRAGNYIKIFKAEE